MLELKNLMLIKELKKTGNDVMKLFQELNDPGQTIILITHEEDIAMQSKRTITIKDGLIESDIQN